MLIGDNGIISKAQNAKNNTDESQELEQIQLAATTAKTNENSTINKQTLRQELKNIPGIEGVPETDNEAEEKAFPWIVKGNTGKEYIIDEKGNVTKKGIKISASDYGAVVTNYNKVYDSSEHEKDNTKGNVWRVFYDDGINVYLIADDYAKYDDVKDVYKNPENKLYKNSDYGLSFNSIVDDKAYSDGSKWIIDHSKAKKWLNQYLIENPTSTNINIKAVAYLMDTEIWSKKFSDNKYAEYAIGGPTLEMYCASYKETHPDKYIECEAKNSTNGYGIKWKDDENYSNSINGIKPNENNKIYMKIDNNKTYGMWLATTPANDIKGIIYVGGYSINQRAYNDNYNNNSPGLRPIVCLKPSIQLTKNADETYTIK